ncbi:MATE efflux family protein [Russula aff. rugulosa BPL654]|nr:MATE efflux family protein [Russula aff. rugulosa BPL654]
MDETTLLLPARSCSGSSSSPSGSVQPDRRMLANESGSNSSRVLEAEAQSRYRGLREIAILFRASVPVIFSYTLQLSLQTVSVAVVARLGSTELSVSAFSLMLAFVTGWCVALGGSTALDTLGSQAFTGGKHSTDLSIHFQRCLLMLWLIFIPVGIMWTNVAPILRAFGQDEELSHGTQQYLRVLLLAAPGYIGFETLKKYLQCQGIMDASTYVLILITPINVVLNVYFVHYTEFGIYGSPIALSFTFSFAFFFLIIYTAYSPAHKQNGTWGGFQLRAVLDPRSCIALLKLALPGILMVGTEWAAFEIVALAAARLGTVPRAAQSVIMTTDQILNSIPFGIGVAASTRVGNAIGRRDAAGAKLTGHLSALLSVITGIIVMVSLLLAKDVYGYCFSNDESVVHLVSQVMPLVASFQVADGLAGSCGGVLRGQGRQHLGAAFNLVAYYVLALPLGIALAFHWGYGLPGLWVGQVVALFIVGTCEYAVVWLGTDWDHEIEKGVWRNNQEMMYEVNGRVSEVSA